MGELRGDGIGKVFPGGARALSGVSFGVAPGRVLTLLGPSGCGKSTLLRIVAGLERASEGTLTLDGRRIDELPPGERDVGFVFQNYALYPHLSVARNLSLALEVRRVPKADVERRVQEAATLLGISPLLDRRPGQLSGGQQQRVALGRALVRRPRLYLMDEPLSNLDALLREEMRGELKALFRRLEATVLYVTHDQGEAMALSDEVVVLKDGAVRQCAPPLEVYARPADLFTATFVGSPRMTVWRGRAEGGELLVSLLRIPLPRGLPARGELWVGVRPEDVEVAGQSLPGGWEGIVEVAEPMGDRTLVTIAVGGERIRALGPSLPASGSVWVRLPPQRLHWFDGATEARLEATP